MSPDLKFGAVFLGGMVIVGITVAIGAEYAAKIVHRVTFIGFVALSLIIGAAELWTTIYLASQTLPNGGR